MRITQIWTCVFISGEMKLNYDIRYYKPVNHKLYVQLDLYRDHTLELVFRENENVLLIYIYIYIYIYIIYIYI